MTTLLFLAALALTPQQDPRERSAQDSAPAPAAARAQDPRFRRDFGSDGEKGALRIWFDRRGASIYAIQLLDHYVDSAAKRKAKEERTDEDYQLLVYGGADFSLPLKVESPRGADGFFPQIEDRYYDAWDLEETGDGSVRFVLDGGKGLKLVKTYRPRPNKREIGLEIDLVADPDSKAAGELALRMPGLVLTNAQEISLFGNPCVAIATTIEGDRFVLHPSPGNVQAQAMEGKRLSMAGTTDRFFGAFLFPLDGGLAERAVTGFSVSALPIADDPLTNTKAGTVPRMTYDLRIPIPGAGSASSLRFGIYLGPKSHRVFAEDEDHARFEPILDVDLEPPCCGVTIPFGRQIAGILVMLMAWFHSLVGNWGIAIMMLTILVRGCLSPLNYRMQKSMRAYGARMAVVQPKLKALQEKYKDNKQKLQQEMIAFQREHKLLPPLGGCLPIFLTMPIYVGLFTALRTAYDLRQQAFLPVWITDLSQPDALVHLGWGRLVPFLNLLPLIWIALLVRVTLKTPLPTDPQQRQTQQIMRYMPILFGIMLYNYASGLMLYMVTSMCWSMVESAVIRKKLGPIDPNAAAMAPTPIM